ncbi:MAG: rhodanese-like domain-containing protein, partial [Cellvibrionaceae bacterium]|nr:rhodanese-like domain-containing protein [Cellvibrionaceae bacterium]
MAMDKQHPLPHCVSAEDLKQALCAQDNSTLVFDCRFTLGDPNHGLLSYEQGHIPGAYYLDLEADLSAPVEGHGGRHPLPRLGELQERLRSCGLTRFHTVVVYDDQRCANAARAWWLLRFMGLEQVYILDGGYRAWLAA